MALRGRAIPNVPLIRRAQFIAVAAPVVLRTQYLVKPAAIPRPKAKATFGRIYLPLAPLPLIMRTQYLVRPVNTGRPRAKFTAGIRSPSVTAIVVNIGQTRFPHAPIENRRAKAKVTFGRGLLPPPAPPPPAVLQRPLIHKRVFTGGLFRGYPTFSHPPQIAPQALAAILRFSYIRRPVFTGRPIGRATFGRRQIAPQATLPPPVLISFYRVRPVNTGHRAKAKFTSVRPVPPAQPTRKLLVPRWPIHDNTPEAKRIRSFTEIVQTILNSLIRNDQLVQIAPTEWEIDNAGFVLTSAEVIAALGYTPLSSASQLLSQGPFAPQSAVDDASYGTDAWTTPENVITSDDAYATATTNGSSTHYLKATNFGFQIPSVATIQGVLFEVEWFSPLVTFATQDVVKLVVNGSPAGNNMAGGTLAYASGADTIVYFNGTTTGGSQICPLPSAATKWGINPLNPAIVNAQNFGVVVATRSAMFLGGTPQVDRMRLTVYYTLP